MENPLIGAEQLGQRIETSEPDGTFIRFEPDPDVRLATSTEIPDAVAAFSVASEDAVVCHWLEAPVTSACSITNRSRAQAVPPPAATTTARPPPRRPLLVMVRLNGGFVMPSRERGAPVPALCPPFWGAESWA